MRASTHTHTHTHVLFSPKPNEILQFSTTWMDLKDIILSEISHTGKEKYHMFTLTCEI